MPSPTPIPTIATLLTCHNRKALTLQCLGHLHSQQGKDASFTLDIYLVDDGCSDGTADAVREQFPGVNIITGNGNLFWNGGMRLAWQTARPGNPDFYLWINDDSLLYSDAVAKLLNDYQVLRSKKHPVGAIAGTMVDPGSKTANYGGRRIISLFNTLKVERMNPQQQPQACDYLNGNLVLVPAGTVEAIGILDATYLHAYGDYDYSCRLHKAGMGCWLGSGIHGECSINTKLGPRNTRLTMQQRREQLRKVEKLYPYRDHMYFIRHHGGPFWPFWWAKTWLRAYFPWLWLLLTRQG